jgi:hypothetical protein
MRRVLLLLAGVVTVSYADPDAPKVSDFYGRWQVSEVVGYASVGAGIPHAKEILGQTLVVSADAITFEDETCKPTTGFRVKVVDTARDLRENSKATREDAELPRTAPLLTSDNCIEIYWLNARKIEFDDGGVFFRAYRH